MGRIALIVLRTSMFSSKVAAVWSFIMTYIMQYCGSCNNFYTTSRMDRDDEKRLLVVAVGVNNTADQSRHLHLLTNW